jgi:hypothetical protein
MNQPTKKTPHVCDGHVWLPTASPLIERCGRAGCKAMRQFRAGAWTIPEALTARATPTAKQPDLWA